MAKSKKRTPAKAISIEDFLKFLEETPRSSLQQSEPTYLQFLKSKLSTENSLEEFKNLKEKVLVFILYNACSSQEVDRNLAFEIFVMLVPLLENQRHILYNSLDKKTLDDIYKDMIVLCKCNAFQHVCKLLSTIIKVLDKALHTNRYMLNKLLLVLKKTFKIDTATAQAASYNTWKDLIDNFAIDKDLLVHDRHKKLLILPLMSYTTAFEEANLARFNTWWHLVFRLEEKLESEFSSLCLPLLSMIFEFPSSSVGDNLNLSTSSNMSAGDTPSSKNVLLKGCEIVIRLVESSAEGAISLSMPALKEPVSNQLFISHLDELLKYTKTALQVYSENGQIESAKNLLHLLLQRMMSVYQEELTDALEKMANFLCFFPNILMEIEFGCIYSLKLIDEITRSLPNSVLASPSLNEAVDVFPAYEFIRILTNKRRFPNVSQNNSYLPAFSKLVGVGAEDKIPFQFFYSTFVLLEYLLPEKEAPPCHSDMLSKMWYTTTCVLYKKTHDINMDDSFEHNFASLLSALTFPFKLLLRHPLDEMSLSLKHQKMWENICHALFRLESNSCCEELCQKWLELLSAPHANSPSLSYWVLQSSCLKIILKYVDFQQVNMSSGAVQSRIGDTDVKHLGSLHSFSILVSRVVSWSVAGSSESLKKSSTNTLTLQATCMDLFADFLDRVRNSDFMLALLSHLVPILVALFTETKMMALGCESTKITEQLWESIAKIIQSRYGGERGQTWFNVLSPLLEVTLVNRVGGIQEVARQVWLSLFATNQSQLVFNNSFNQVLKKSRPPLVALNDISPEESCSDTSSGDEHYETAVHLSSSPLGDESSCLQLESSTTPTPKVSTPDPRKPKVASQKCSQIANLSTPSAESPSAGILKSLEKRKKSIAEEKKSPSPSAKQRRVSFVDPLTIQQKGVSSSRRLQMASTHTNTDNGIEELEPEPIVTQDEESQMITDMVISEEESVLNRRETIFQSSVDSKVHTASITAEQIVEEQVYEKMQNMSCQEAVQHLKFYNAAALKLIEIKIGNCSS